MNIVHIEDEPWDSGIAHYAATLAAEQSRRGHRVEFWGLAGSPALKDAAARGLTTRGWRPGAGGWASLAAQRGALADVSADIVNAHTGSAQARALAISPPGAAVVRTRGDARAPRSNLLTRWAAARTSFLIAANTATQDALEAAFPESPVRLVAQGVDGPPEAAPLPENPLVGMIARLDPVKGHDVLLDAAKRLQPEVLGLHVMCAGEGRLLDGLRGSLARRGLTDSVHFLGWVGEKWNFLSSCRVGVVASTGSEAVSRAALEWMAAGRPLVATRVGGLPDLVEQGVTGLLVAPADAAAMAQALRLILANPAGAEAMGRAARERWAKRFSPGPFYEATQAVYEEAIHSLSR